MLYQEGSISIVVSFHILQIRASQFELCLKLREPIQGLIGKIRREIYNDSKINVGKLTVMSPSLNFFLQIYRLKISDWCDIECFLDELGANIGRRIPVLCLTNCDEHMPDVFKLVAKISFSGMHFGVVNLTDEFA